MREEHYKKLVDRLDRALSDLYHNATPTYPDTQNDYEWDRFQSWFGDQASFEVEYLNDGGAAGKTPYSKFDKYKDAHPKIRQIMYNRWLRDRHPAEQITEFGKLYTWGRGGRTLAPDKLIKQRGGGSFSIRSADDIIDSFGMTKFEIVDAITIIEAFNKYVEEWNKCVPDMWKEHKADDEDLSDETIASYDGKKHRERTIVEYY